MRRNKVPQHRRSAPRIVLHNERPFHHPRGTAACPVHMKKALLLAAAIVLLIALAGMYKFNVLSGQPGHDVDGNPASTPTTGTRP